MTAHAAEAALLSRSEIKIGDQIPAVEVKENNHEETLTLNNIPGKSVLVSVSMLLGVEKDGLSNIYVHI